MRLAPQPLSPQEIEEIAGAQYAPPVEVIIIGPYPAPPCPPPAQPPSPGGAGRPRELDDYNP